MSEIGAYLLFLFLGMIFWQMVLTIIYIITDNEETVFDIGLGLPALFLRLIVGIIARIRSFYICKRYQPFQIVPTVKYVRVLKKDIGKYYQEGEFYYHIKPCNGKAYRYEPITKVKKDGWFCQEWVNENLVKRPK